jgi:hypothetical protein
MVTDNGSDSCRDNLGSAGWRPWRLLVKLPSQLMSRFARRAMPRQSGEKMANADQLSLFAAAFILLSFEIAIERIHSATGAAKGVDVSPGLVVGS